MPVNKRRAADELLCPDEDSVRIIQQNMAGRSTAAMTKDIGKVRPPRSKGNTLEVIANKAQALVAAEAVNGKKK